MSILELEKKQPSVEVKTKKGELLDKEEHINKRWKEYFMELLRGEEDNTEGEEGEDIGYEYGQSRDEVAEEQTTDEEMVEAIRKMKNGTATRCDCINIEMLKSMGTKGMELVRILFNKV
ncbi:hypothetical protein HHI36_010850 [Cryptolaemus montrouzieri]|uniref:Uncharacterized protein n=1 Tax=Cryptolaemus montrouzieri TaxID=559131 RepID=A0ABD2MK29_9CUCU